MTSFSQVQTSRELIHKHNTQVCIWWVPAHVFLVHHDLANLFAKERPCKRIFRRLYLQQLRKQSFSKTAKLMQKWEHSTPFLRTAQIACLYHKTFPHGRPRSLNNLPRRNDTIITRLRLHHYMSLTSISKRSAFVRQTCAMSAQLTRALINFFSTALSTQVSL